MKHVSWVLALVVGGVIGYALHGSIASKPGPSRPQAAQQPARPSRPVEDPKAIYRVPVEDSPAKGPAAALVTIVESSDFECPFCKRVLPTLKQVEDAYAGKVRFVWKHNPLSFHARALPSAIAAEEARAQGGDAKFWAMHDALFASAPALSDDDIVRAGQGIGLDATKLREALASRRHVDRIQRDQRLVTSIGASGTPAFFVNGRKVSGAVPFESFKAVIDEELTRAEAMVRSGTPAGELYARIVERGATAPVFLPGAATPPAAPQAPPQPPPAAYRKVDLRPDDPVKGARDAKLTIVLFSDFQCPFCSRVEPTLKRIEEEKRGDVRIVWKHQPLGMHPNAMPAAMAAEAAREQGKFWEMHERLFANQQDLGPAAFERYARELRLDLARFKRGMESDRARSRIQEDQRLASSVGATGTPTMFLNCRQVVGAQPYERMMPIVEEEIRKVDALLRSGAKRDASLYQRACEANLSPAPAAAGPSPSPSPSPVPAPSLPAANVPLRPDDPIRGSASAPVTIALFSDFQCPFCSRVEPTLRQIEQEYRGKVKIAWKHQPLVQIHPHAIPAALAAEAAREQGKFWEMHDKLFENQAALPTAPYERFAREIGLDVAQWKRAYDSGKYRSRIEEDQRLAASLGIGGTPTLVVNGERVVGAVPYDQVKAVVERKLAEARR